LRKVGPFNVDRAPTGQFVSKGSINNPIDEYPDSKTKLRREKGVDMTDDRRKTRQASMSEDEEDYNENADRRKSSRQ
jgi:hypothetical protein